MKKIITLLLAFFTVINLCTAQTQKGLDIDGEAADDLSGWSVSMPDKNTMAIGSRWNDGVNGSNSGHVRIYHWSGNAWVQKGMDIDGEAAYDISGWSVSMPDSNTVAIGAYQNDGNGTDAGHVRIYYWNGSAWVQKGMDIDAEAIYDYSGYSVSMPDSNTVAIGAYFNDGVTGFGSNSGHVRVYRWNGNTWVQKGMDLDGFAAGDESGNSVSMPDSNTLAIGAQKANYVRIYSWNGSAWVQKGNGIVGEVAGDKSGWSVSMPDNNTVAIGAIANGGNGYASGHVRIYRWSGNTWVQKGGDIDGEAVEDLSGHSVSMPDSNTVAIGAMGNDGNGFDAGHVRIYRWNGSAWVQKGIDIDGEAIYDQSGYSVSMPDSNTVAIGAPRNNGNGSLTGHTRVYSLCTPTSSMYPVTACFSYIWPLNGATYTSSTNSATATITNAAGCDSVVTLNLTINTVNVLVTNTSPTLTSNAIGATYQWLDCANNFAVISGETNQAFTPTVNGSYAVEVSENNCIDTSTCEVVSNVGILENDFGNSFTAFPNPVNGNISINLGINYTDVTVMITNQLGQNMVKKSFRHSNLLQLDLPGEAGVYFIEVRADGKNARLKVLKE